MASCKTLVIGFVLLPSLIVAYPTSPPENGYRFADEYSRREETTAPSEERKESSQKCEKVIKNGMLCSICKEPETNAKYEQCSYASHPQDDFEFTTPKSGRRSSSKRKEQDNSKRRQATKRRYENDDDKEDESSSSSPYSGEFFDVNHNPDDVEDYRPSGSQYISESERISKNMKGNDCEDVVKDGMICSVCKDPETDGTFEKCRFAYQPKEKSYKYTKSKSFGYPKMDELSNKRKKKAEGRQSYRRNHEDDEPEASPVDGEQYALDDNGCREVIKDSMTCNVCVDPETKEESEQCSFSYRPDDKMYAYSQSSSFGTPKKYPKKYRE